MEIIAHFQVKDVKYIVDNWLKENRFFPPSIIVTKEE